MADKGKEVNVQLNNRTTQYLTGLYNASGYIQSVERLNRFKKLQNYTAFFFNIKGFGNINKKYGSKEGDEIIKRYAMKLKAFVQKDEYLGHLGEDDFVALILKARRDTFFGLLCPAESLPGYPQMDRRRHRACADFGQFFQKRLSRP